MLAYFHSTALPAKWRRAHPPPPRKVDDADNEVLRLFRLIKLNKGLMNISCTYTKTQICQSFAKMHLGKVTGPSK